MIVGLVMAPCRYIRAKHLTESSETIGVLRDEFMVTQILSFIILTFGMVANSVGFP